MSDFRPRPYLSLLRPPNVVTALADVLAGYAAAGVPVPVTVHWLLGATACLYAGGVVLNDYFDRDLDRVERPERPIPSGQIPAGRAAALGGALLAAGVALAAAVNAASLAVAAGIAALVLLYDTWGKHHLVIAPVNMGLCRALNLLLGVSAAPAALAASLPLACIPLAYIAGVTAVSRGEVHGGDRRIAAGALVFLGLALTGLALLVVGSPHAILAGIVLAVLVWRIVPPFVQVLRTVRPMDIRHAVVRGVLSLALVNTVIGTALAGPAYGGAILATALAAGWLARRLAVT